MSEQEECDKALVSIVIPTYNSEKTLSKCLKSIRNQTYKNIEIIVVDKNSRDKTVDIAKNYNAKVFQLNVERAEAKNFGLKNATGKYIFFVDSDMELTRDVIRECVDLIESNEKIGGVIIPEKSVGKSFWVKVRDFERSFYVGTEAESARFFRRDLAEEVGGFDEDIVFFEESTLPQKIGRLGYNVRARISANILHHEEDFSLPRWLRKKFYYGSSVAEYKKRYGNYATKQLGISYRLSIFLRDKKFYSKTVLAIGVLILKILEYCSVELGAFASKLKRS